MAYRYFYVKTGGTATSTYFSTPRTGSWASALPNTSDYWNSLYDCWNHAANDYNYLDNYNNFIMVSDTYSDTTTISDFDRNPYYTNGYVRVGGVFSVDNNNVDIMKKGATYTTTATGYDLTLTPVAFCVYGFNATPNSGAASRTNTVNKLGGITENCTITGAGTGTPNMVFHGELFSCTIDKGSNTATNIYAHTDIGGYGGIAFLDCDFIHTTTTSDVLFTSSSYTAPDIRSVGVFCMGCDFTQANRPLVPALLPIDSATTQNELESPSVFEGCTFGSNNYVPYQDLYRVISGKSPYTNPILTVQPMYIHSNCTSSPAQNLPRNYLRYSYANSLHSGTTYRDNGAVWNLNEDKYSIQLTVDNLSSFTDTSTHLFKMFYLSKTWLDMSLPYTFTVYIKDTVGLKKDQIWLDIYYTSRDLTNNTSVTKVATTKEITLDFGGASALSSSGETWNGSSTGSKRLDLTAGGDGSLSVVYFYIGMKQNCTAYVCPKVEY